MKKLGGFTLIELILTLVLSGILASIVVEIIAGPIRSYFWVAQQAVKVQNAELAMGNLARDLQWAFPSSVHIESQNNTHTLIFKKIRSVVFPQGTTTPTVHLSPAIQYSCTPSTHLLERIEGEDRALVNNAIVDCDFSLFEDGKSKGIMVTLLLGSKGEPPSRFTQPIFFENRL